MLQPMATNKVGAQDDLDSSDLVFSVVQFLGSASFFPSLSTTLLAAVDYGLEFCSGLFIS